MSLLLAAWGWVVTSRIGRFVAGAAAIALAILAALAAARRGGVKAAQREIEERRMQAARKRREIEGDVNALDDTELGDQLDEWVRDPRR